MVNINPATCVFLVILEGDLVQTPEHLGVSYLVSILRRQGHRCTLLDVSPSQDSQIINLVKDLHPDFVGFSLTTVNLQRASELGRALRAQLGSGVHICAGGPVATFAGEQLLQSPDWAFLDAIVRGEAEGIIVRLVAAALNGEAVRDIPGVAVRGAAQPLTFAPAVDDLDVLPWPARDQLAAYQGRFPYVRVLTSRGCTSHCTFCNAPHARNRVARRKVWRGRSPEDVVDELAFLNARYGVDTFDFIDSTFEDPNAKIGKQRVRRIAELILDRELRIYYNICAQAKNWSEDDNDLIDLLYRSGLEKVLIGVESGSQRTLELFKKRSTTADNHRAIRLFRKHGIYVAFGFIMFHPYADWQDVEANAVFLQANIGHNLRRFVVRLELYPGAEIVQQLAADNLLYPDYWQTLNPFAYRYVNPEIGRMAQMINSLFGKNYASLGSIAREPGVFAFETFDITLHTFLSRLWRAHGDEPVAQAAIREHTAIIDAQKARLTAFNVGLFQDIMAWAKAGSDIPTGLAETVEGQYTQAIEQIKSIQLRLGMKLRRQGIPLSLTRSVVHA